MNRHLRSFAFAALCAIFAFSAFAEETPPKAKVAAPNNSEPTNAEALKTKAEETTAKAEAEKAEAAKAKAKAKAEAVKAKAKDEAEAEAEAKAEAVKAKAKAKAKAEAEAVKAKAKAEDEAVKAKAEGARAEGAKAEKANASQNHAGDAHGHDEPKGDVKAPVPTEEKKASAHYVTYHEQKAPLFFARERAGNTAADRARISGNRLAAALDEGAKSKDKDATRARVSVQGENANVTIGKTLIATLSKEDALDAGYNLPEYAQALEVPLNAFIKGELERSSWKSFFLHLFFSVFVMVLAFVTLGFLRKAFDRLDAILEEKRGTLDPISIFHTEIFSGDALSGALSIGASIGRYAAYIATFLATFAFVFSQFDVTRPLVNRMGTWSAGPIVSAIDGIVGAIPGLLLAAIIFVLIFVALRVLNLLLDGVQKKRIVWKQIPPERVPTFRFVATVGTLVLCAPLLVAAVFGGYGTPLETLALGAGGVILVAAIPTVSNYVIGVVWLWRNSVRPGDWVQVGRYSGEVTEVSFHEMRLVPEGGGTIAIPALYLLIRPMRRLRGNPQLSIDLTVARDRPAADLLKAMRHAVLAVDDDAQVECVDLCHAWLKIHISAPAIRSQLREQILVAVSDAVDRHEFELPVLHGQHRLVDSMSLDDDEPSHNAAGEGEVS